jgi:hypothetical protein
MGEDMLNRFYFVLIIASFFVLNQLHASQMGMQEEQKLRQSSGNANDITTPQEFVLFARTASPYKILGIAYDANEDAIQKAFRALSLKFHPDKWKSLDQEATANEAFKIISNARNTLLQNINLYGRNEFNSGTRRQPTYQQQSPYTQQETSSYSPSYGTKQSQIPQKELKEFFEAAFKNHAKVFEFLQKYGKNIVNESDFLNDPILITAASEYWTPEELERILQIPGIDINKSNVFTPLTKAMNRPLGGDPDEKQLRKIQMLINHNVNVNRVDAMGFTPLMSAAMDNQPKVVLMLLRAGATTEGAVNNRSQRVGETFWTYAKKHPAVMSAVHKYNKEMEQEKRKIQQETAAARQEGGWQDVSQIIGEYASPQIHIEDVDMTDAGQNK